MTSLANEQTSKWGTSKFLSRARGENDRWAGSESRGRGRPQKPLNRQNFKPDLREVLPRLPLPVCFQLSGEALGRGS